MDKTTTIGIDLAKFAFQFQGIDVDRKVVLRHQLKRSEVLAFSAKLEPYLIGMEAHAEHITGRVNWPSSVTMSG